MWKAFLITIVFTVCGVAQLWAQDPVPALRDTIVNLPQIVIDTVVLEQETPSSVPLGNEPVSGPRSYRRVIHPDAITRKGLFTVHKVEDKYYFEIPDSLLGNDLLVVTRISRGAAGVRPGYSGYAGDQIGSTVIRFEKGPDDNLFLRRVSFGDYSGDSTNSMFDAVVRSNLQPLAASFGISAYTPDRRASVIDVTNYINGDNDVLFFSPGVKQQMKVGRMLSNMCYIKDIQPYPLNVEIRTIKTYEREASASSSSFTWELNTSILLLPRVPMKKRFADRRIGYFTERYTDYSTNPQGVEVVSYIKRWRLEPRPEDLEKYRRGELVEPETPIVFYIDPATPRKWVPYLIQGVNDWQVAFEAAGFKNAIMAREVPDKLEDPDWNMDDSRHSMIVYKPSEWTNATGHMITDPRSGEIIASQVNFYHNIMSMLRTWYMIQCGTVDKRAQQMNFDDQLMGRLIRSVVSHETGHALGLLHNFGASSTVPVERLRDKEWLDANGICPSVMDYARFNYVAQPQDSVGQEGLIARIGSYDKWAIEWGYRLFPFTPLDDPKNYLSTWTIAMLQDPRLWYGSEFSPSDPRSQTEDLGDNAMRASEYGMKNLQRVVPHLIDWTYQESEDYSGLTEVYTGVTQQYSNYLRHVTRYIGGTYQTIKTYDQPGAVYLPVPAHLQRNAVYFLDEHLFNTPSWLLDSTVLARVGRAPLQILGKYQNMVLSNLMSLSSLRDLVHAESMYGNRTYGISSFFFDMDRSIFRELRNNDPVDIFRRSLQRNYVDKLITLADGTTIGKGYDDILPEVYAQLRSLREKLPKAIRKSEDLPTRHHLQYILDQLNEVVPGD